ncbi:MAG: HAMP domain-containing protein, partial [Parachlamydiaceae bacterium]
SESNEQVLYKDPKAFATSIYEAKGTNDLYMSGYAPLFNSKRQVYALVGSNLNLDIFNHMIHRAVLLIVGASIVSLILVGSVVYLITNKISEPVQKLKEAALSLAAGEYEEKISVSGPKEIVDLANTYNTMRECLLENINRLRDISYSREVLFGEQECALLLQHRMLDVVIEQFHDPRLAIKHIASSSSTLGYGAKLLIDQGKDHINLTFQQSHEEGFEGIYHLLSGENGNFSQADLDFNFSEKQLDVRTQSMPLPIFWSLQQMRFLPDGDKHSFASGDLVLLYNQELEDAFPSRAAIKEWLNRVFRQFGKDPMALMATMLGSELNFWQKKQPTTRNVHLYLIKT